MSYNLTTKSIGNGINFNYTVDRKFKHNRITINLILPLNKETATINALVPFVIRQGCEQYPDFLLLNRRLAELYGAVISSDVSKYGAYQVLDITVQSIDNRFALNGEDMMTEIAELLAMVVTRPFVKDNSFDSHIVKLEKQFLFDTIEAEINDKRGYALMKCKEIMCKDEPFAVKKYGYSHKVDEINAQTAYTQYKEIMKTAAIEIMMTGCGNQQGAMELLEKTFKGMKREPIAYPIIRGKISANVVQYETEVMDLSQSKLVLGFRTGENNTPRELNAARLLIAIYGATPTSKLFLNVREKLSLCYYCVSRMDKVTGILMVDCGVEAKNMEKAKSEILNQLELCKNGDITEEELLNARLAMKNGLNSVEDGLGSTEDWYMSQIMCDTKLSPSDEAKLLDEITIEDLQKVAQKITLDTVYFLTGKEN